MNNEEMIKLHFQKVYEIVLEGLNEPLKNFVKNCSFIAGGSIRSLLTDKPINDYDFYFYDLSICHLFASEIHRILKPSTSVEYFSNSDLLKFDFKSETENAFTFYSKKLDKKIQFIIKYSGKPNDVINTFDLTNCMAYYEYEENNLYISNKMKEAILNKKLEFNLKPNANKTTMKRFFRFVREGYEPNIETMQIMIDFVKNMNETEYNNFIKNISYT